MTYENCGFGTKAIHAGHAEDKQFGSLATPIYQTSTFAFESCEQGGRRFAGAEKGYNSADNAVKEIDNAIRKYISEQN